MSVVASFAVSLQRRRTTDQHEKLLTSPFHNGIKNHTRHTQKSGKWYIYNNQNSILSVALLCHTDADTIHVVLCKWLNAGAF